MPTVLDPAVQKRTPAPKDLPLTTYHGIQGVFRWNPTPSHFGPDVGSRLIFKIKWKVGSRDKEGVYDSNGEVGTSMVWDNPQYNDAGAF